MAVEKVLVVGAGIGGLTLAAALGQRGIETDIVEIKPSPEVQGVGILQPGNALRALDSIGVLDECFAAGFQTDEYRYFDADGGLIAKLRLLRIADASRPAINMLPRPALHRILSGAAERAGARLRLGVTVGELEQSDEGVAVGFTDGRRGSYDLVVGADGIRSSIRAMIFGPGRAAIHRPRRVAVHDIATRRAGLSGHVSGRRGEGRPRPADQRDDVPAAGHQ